MANPAVNNNLKTGSSNAASFQTNSLELQRFQLANNLSQAIFKQNPGQTTLPAVRKIVLNNIEAGNGQLKINQSALAKELADKNILGNEPRQVEVALANVLAQFRPSDGKKSEPKATPVLGQSAKSSSIDCAPTAWLAEPPRINTMDSDALTSQAILTPLKPEDLGPQTPQIPSWEEVPKDTSLTKEKTLTDLTPTVVTTFDTAGTGLKILSALGKNLEGLTALSGSNKILNYLPLATKHISTGFKLAGEVGLAIQAGWAAIDQTAFLVENTADLGDYVLTIPTRVAYDISLGTGSSIVSLFEAAGAAVFEGENFFTAWQESSGKKNDAMQYYIPIKFNKTDQYGEVISWDASGLVNEAKYFTNPLNSLQTGLYFIGLDQKGDLTGELKVNLSQGNFADAYVSLVRLTAGEAASQVTDALVHGVIPQTTQVVKSAVTQTAEQAVRTGQSAMKRTKEAVQQTEAFIQQTAQDVRETGAEVWQGANLWANQAAETGSQFLADGQYMIQKASKEVEDAAGQVARKLETAAENTVQTGVENLTRAGQFISSLF